MRLTRITVVVLILSLALFAYPVWRLCDWFGLQTPIALAIVLPCFFSQVLARLLLRNRHGRGVYLLRTLADFFLGLSPVLLALVLIGELVTVTTAAAPLQIGQAVMSLSFMAALWGVWRAWRPDLETVRLQFDNLERSLRFVQISDVHIGSRTRYFLRQVMQRVHTLEPDFLCITGDFIDQVGVGLDILQPLAEFDRPIYFCTGNHERYEDLEDIIQRLESLGVQVLRNRVLRAHGIQIVGIEDHDHRDQVARALPFIELDSTLFTLLLYHRPQGLEAAQRYGVDLKLSGHTHNGQIVPFNLAVQRVFDYTCGLYEFKSSYLYVNEGTGTWGPTMRLGSRSEITLFELFPGHPRGPIEEPI